jgi:hypothetical protein
MGVHRNGLCVDSMNPTPLQIATTPSGIHIAYLDKSHRYKIGHDDEGVARSEVTMNFYAATAQIIPILLFTRRTSAASTSAAVTRETATQR